MLTQVHEYTPEDLEEKSMRISKMEHNTLVHTLSNITGKKNKALVSDGMQILERIEIRSEDDIDMITADDLLTKLDETGQVYIVGHDIPISVSKYIYQAIDQARRLEAAKLGIPEMQYEFEDLFGLWSGMIPAFTNYHQLLNHLDWLETQMAKLPSVSSRGTNLLGMTITRPICMLKEVVKWAAVGEINDDLSRMRWITPDNQHINEEWALFQKDLKEIEENLKWLREYEPERLTHFY